MCAICDPSLIAPVYAPVVTYNRALAELIDLQLQFAPDAQTDPANAVEPL
jgi:hypothetical protein